MTAARTVESEIIVIGAGIAGASVAAELAQQAKVSLLEMESQPGYHTTGRSAAIFVPSYGPPSIRALTRASAAAFLDPVSTLGVDRLLSPRPVLMMARGDQLESLDKLKEEVAANTPIQDLTASQVEDLNPLLRPGYAAAGILDVDSYDIDVDALHQAYLRKFKSNSGRLFTNARVEGIAKAAADWQVETSAGTHRAPIIINAAGAWVDDINTMAGLAAIGLVPKRRTMIVVDPPAGFDIASLPMTADVDEQFYIKPEAGQLVLSPADETPSPPCDAQPEELDIAIGIDRIEKAFNFPITRPKSSWAGLRSFVADGVPVVGFADPSNSFFILAGQGGYGIQTCPALARLAAALVTGKAIPPDIVDQGLVISELSPDRLNCPHKDPVRS
ncbi:MAG: FAD-binding oxidoreductase [Rhizobiaceae bacterium]|nr:FAD-binding oxidoreductase [Rhizobiaceae bacterium]